MSKYKINEIFYSIQGEGFYTGTPCVFIRFSGCNLKCEFCDTKHDDYTEMTGPQILGKIKLYPTKHIVMTGGEPSLQIDKDLIFLLKDKGNILHIETNGLEIEKLNRNTFFDWITCSPKTDKYIAYADEYKFIVGENFDFKKVKENYLKIRHAFDPQGISAKQPFLYLQPKDNKPENIKKCIDLIKEDSEWRLSLQMQKLINIR